MTASTLRPVRELRYGWFLRWRDGRDARADARADVAGNDRPTPWIERNRHTFLERAASERLDVEAHLHPTLERYRIVSARAAALDEAIAEVDERLLRDAPTESDLAQRRPSEAELSMEAARARRTREAAQHSAGARARRAAWIDERSMLMLERGALQGAIQVAWRGILDRVDQLQRFHSRRQETYRRSYLRRLARRRELATDDPVLVTNELPAPSWAAAECPWLDARLGAPLPVQATSKV